MSEGEIVHIEFAVKDLESAKEFYADLFGWKIEAWGGVNYATFAPKAGPGGGFAPFDGNLYNPGEVIVYIQTENLEKTLSQIEGLGGKILMARTPIDDKSWFAFFTDPFGNRVGLYTTAAPAV